jgi:hypothetical protein
MFNISPGLQITSWWDTECAVQVFFYYLALFLTFTDVGAPLLEQVRYHLPVIGLLHHSSKPSTSYKRKIFLYDKGDFDSYRQQLTDVDWETLFGHNDVDTIVDIITNTILNIADNTKPCQKLYLYHKKLNDFYLNQVVF